MVIFPIRPIIPVKANEQHREKFKSVIGNFAALPLTKAGVTLAER